MEPIKFKGTQKLSKTERFFENIKEKGKVKNLDEYGKMGVEALKEYTPKDTGKTANSWSYEIVNNKSGSIIYWNNSNIVDGVNIALILQYGHSTASGYYVQGVDYINPAMKPIFDEIAEKAWREVKNV